MVTLKLKVAPTVFARLFDELKQTHNQLQVIKRTIPEAEFGSYPLKEVSVNFVRILPGERKFDGEEMEMTLELIREVPDADEHQGVKPERKVPREMTDRLFDFLDLYPRTAQPQTTLFEVQAQLRTIAQKLEAIYDLAGKSVDVSNPLNETVIEIREMARVALQLAAVPQLVE